MVVEEQKKYFVNVSYGDVFKHHDQHFLRIVSTINEGKDQPNAARLSDGFACTFNDSDLVTVVSCKLIVG